MKLPLRRGEVPTPNPDFIEDSRDAERVGKPNPLGNLTMKCQQNLTICVPLIIAVTLTL